MFLRISVARLLSSQKPGLRESCLSSAIFCCRLATSKKPPYPGNAGPHIIQFFDCHGAKISELGRLWLVWPAMIIIPPGVFFFEKIQTRSMLPSHCWFTTVGVTPCATFPVTELFLADVIVPGPWKAVALLVIMFPDI